MKRYAANVEGDLWYTMWAGLGDSSYYQNPDYDISPTMVYGVAVCGSYRTSHNTWFGLGASYLLDFQQEKIADAFGEEVQKTTEIISGLTLFSLGRDWQFYTKVQWGRFNGVLNAQPPRGFETDWVLADLLWVAPPPMTSAKGPQENEQSTTIAARPWIGVGFRMIRYDQPMLIQTNDFYYAELVSDVGHSAYCLYAKAMDASHFGIPDPTSILLFETGMGIGVAVDEIGARDATFAGIDWNWDLDAGVKYVLTLGGLGIGMRAGYRVFMELFTSVGGEWVDGQFTVEDSTTQCNLFHGPFASVNASF